MLNGKGAMVWKLRNWMGGDPLAQAQHAIELGVAWVSLKVVDGRAESWENPRAVPLPRQNVSLLPETIAALRAAGIGVAGWGYSYGGVYRFGLFFPSQRIAQEEGAFTASVLEKHGMVEFQIDAEREYRRGGDRASRAEAYGLGLLGTPRLQPSLCSYRFPISSASDFPTRAFAPTVQSWSPQVYWIRDDRAHGGAVQLESSVAEYQSIRPLPMTPVGPSYQDRGWRATPEQLKLFFDMARELPACLGVGVWCLDLATPSQLAALAEFEW